SESIKDGAELSSNGKWVVFSETSDPNQAQKTDPSVWNVVLVDTENNKKWSIGSGVAPFFLDNNHLARFTKEGIVITSLMSMTDYKAVSDTKYDVDPRSITQSPDGQTVGWSDSKGQKMTIMRITDEGFVPVASFDGPILSFSLSNDVAYILKQNKGGGTDVVKYFPDGTQKKIHNFPSVLKINRIIL
ncbi:MAG: hypothetical protein AABZ06_04845, partial [Bdellovibrionota bacterium]